jgi:hypothetical protein
VRVELGLAVSVELSLSIFSEDSLSYNLLKDEGNPLEHWKAEPAYILLKSNFILPVACGIFTELYRFLIDRKSEYCRKEVTDRC